MQSKLLARWTALAVCCGSTASVAATLPSDGPWTTPLSSQVSFATVADLVTGWSATLGSRVRVDPMLASRSLSYRVTNLPIRQLMESCALAIDATWERRGNEWFLTAQSNASKISANAWASYQKEWDAQRAEWWEQSDTPEWNILRQVVPTGAEFEKLVSTPNLSWIALTDAQIARIATTLPALARAERAWLSVGASDDPSARMVGLWMVANSVTKLAWIKTWSPVALAFDMDYDQMIQKWIMPLKPETRSKLPTRANVEPPGSARASASTLLHFVSQGYGVNVVVNATRASYPNPFTRQPLRDLGTELDLVMQTCGCSVRDQDGVVIVRPRVGWYMESVDPSEASIQSLASLKSPSIDEYAAYANSLSPLAAYRHSADLVELPFDAVSIGSAAPSLRFWLSLSTQQRRDALNRTPITYPNLTPEGKQAFAAVWTSKALASVDAFREPKLLPAIVARDFSKFEFYLDEIVEPIASYADRAGRGTVTVPVDGIPTDPKIKVKKGARRTYTFYFGLGTGNSISQALPIITWD